MEWHDPVILIPVGLGWSGFMIGAFKLLLDRYLTRLDEQLNVIPTHSQRLTDLEQCLAARPQCQMHAENTLTIKALHKRMDQQHQAMDELIKVVGRIDGRQEGLGRAVDLMNQFLIEQGGNRR